MGSSAASFRGGEVPHGYAVRGSGSGLLGGEVAGNAEEVKVVWSSDEYDHREDSGGGGGVDREEREAQRAHEEAQEALIQADIFLERQRERVAGYDGGVAVAMKSYDSVADSQITEGTDEYEQTQRTLERYGGVDASGEYERASIHTSQESALISSGGSGGGMRDDRHHDEAGVTLSMMAEEREAEAEISRQISAAMAGSHGSGSGVGGGSGAAMALHGGVPFDSLTQEQMNMRLEIERRTAELMELERQAQSKAGGGGGAAAAEAAAGLRSSGGSIGSQVRLADCYFPMATLSTTR